MDSKCSNENLAIEKLIQRMDSSPGFAGLGASIQVISKLGDDSDGDGREISATILRDAALTAKLLRIANSSRNARGGRNVSTIDQALVILGLNTVKSIAMSLALLGSMGNRPQSNLVHGEIVAAYFCGSLAGEITRLNSPRYSAQEAQVCGLMQNLGRMMATYYLFDDIENAREVQVERNVTEAEAVQEVFGTSYEEIGAAISKQWCLPDVLQNSLAADLGKTPPKTVTTSLIWHQLCSTFCRHITNVLFRYPENREKVEIHREIDFFRGALHLRDEEIHELIVRCLEQTDALLAEMSFPTNVEQSRKLLRKASERVLDLLSSQDKLTKDSTKLDGRRPVEIIQSVLRLIHDKYSFDHTLLCLPDGVSNLVAVAGVGGSANQLTAKFRFSGPKPDLFRAIMARKIDAYIADVRAPVYAKLIPSWYHEIFAARSFLMLPIVHEGKLLGLVYGDYSELIVNPPPNTASGEMSQWRLELAKALAAGLTKSI